MEIIIDGDTIIENISTTETYNKNDILEEVNFLEQELSNMNPVEINKNLPAEIINILEEHNHNILLEKENKQNRLDYLKNKFSILWL